MDTVFFWQTTQGHLIIIAYFIIINLIGVAVMAIDKFCAIHNLWRIPEKVLFGVAIIGGALGTMIGMYGFRHKTQKTKFLVGFPIIVVVWIYLIIILITRGFFSA